MELSMPFVYFFCKKNNIYILFNFSKCLCLSENFYAFKVFPNDLGKKKKQRITNKSNGLMPAWIKKNHKKTKTHLFFRNKRTKFHIIFNIKSS